MDGLKGLIIAVGKVVDLATLTVAGIGLLVFLWGLAKFVFKSGGEKAQEEGRNLMVWGLVALFVMVSVWGLVRFIEVALGLRPYLFGIDTLPGANI